jgi:N-6 DNA Methylase
MATTGAEVYRPRPLRLSIRSKEQKAWLYRPPDRGHPRHYDGAAARRPPPAPPWAQDPHLLARQPQGRAVIAVPEGFLFRGGAERDLRRKLLEAGQVEAVIGLPAGVYWPHTTPKSCLLVLSKRGGVSNVRVAWRTPHRFLKPCSPARHHTSAALWLSNWPTFWLDRSCVSRASCHPAFRRTCRALAGCRAPSGRYRSTT